MKRFCSAGAALAVVGVLALAGPASAGETVPFSGSFAGTDIGTPIPNTPFASVTVEATGNATHLGRFAYAAQITVNTATDMTLATIKDILESKVIRRGLSLKILDYQDAETQAHVVDGVRGAGQGGCGTRRNLVGPLDTGIGHRPISATLRDADCSRPAGAPRVCDP